jgi:alpha-1,2-mannosyltransferase
MRLSLLIILLAICRAIAVFVNIVHDCDEVFNYWEPLHYLVHGTGMQTWEYRRVNLTVACHH